MNIIEREKILHIISNSKRVRIIEVLAQSKKALCVRQISEAVEISQTSASQYLSYLTMQDVTKPHPKGRTVYYTLRKNELVKKLYQIIKILN